MNEIRELTEMDAEAVSGGHHHSLIGDIIVRPIIETNIAVPTAIAIGLGGGAIAGAITGGQKNKAI
jgi:hypothetical protein